LGERSYALVEAGRAAHERFPYGPFGISPGKAMEVTGWTGVAGGMVAGVPEELGMTIAGIADPQKMVQYRPPLTPYTALTVPEYEKYKPAVAIAGAPVLAYEYTVGKAIGFGVGAVAGATIRPAWAGATRGIRWATGVSKFQWRGFGMIETGLAAGMYVAIGAPIAVKAYEKIEAGKPLEAIFGAAREVTYVSGFGAGFVRGAATTTGFMRARGERIPPERLWEPTTLETKEFTILKGQRGTWYRQFTGIARRRAAEEYLGRVPPGRYRVWHTTTAGIPKKGGVYEVMPGGYEYPGLFVGPEPSQMGLPSLGGFVKSIRERGFLQTIGRMRFPRYSSEIYGFEAKVITAPVGAGRAKVTRYIGEQVGRGTVVMPYTKAEAEAVLPVGSQLTPGTGQFYTVWEGIRIPVRGIKLRVDYPAPAVQVRPAPTPVGYTFPVSSYRAPVSYSAPSYRAPSYRPPSYRAPSYQLPSYLVPSYQAPSYKPPSYQAPSYKAPSYKPPSYQVPSYRPPSYKPPSYRPPSYKPPRYPPPFTPILLKEPKRKRAVPKRRKRKRAYRERFFPAKISVKWPKLGGFSIGRRRK
jgi:hypothetical protein